MSKTLQYRSDDDVITGFLAGFSVGFFLLLVGLWLLVAGDA